MKINLLPVSLSLSLSLEIVDKDLSVLLCGVERRWGRVGDLHRVSRKYIFPPILPQLNRLFSEGLILSDNTLFPRNHPAERGYLARHVGRRRRQRDDAAFGRFKRTDNGVV